MPVMRMITSKEKYDEKNPVCRRCGTTDRNMDIECPNQACLVLTMKPLKRQENVGYTISKN